MPKNRWTKSNAERMSTRKLKKNLFGFAVLYVVKYMRAGNFSSVTTGVKAPESKGADCLQVTAAICQDVRRYLCGVIS